MPNVTEKMKEASMLDHGIWDYGPDSNGRKVLRLTKKGKQEYENKKAAYIDKMQPNCPEGYTVVIPGQLLDMLGRTELWLIHSNNPDPYCVRIPQDYVDYGDGKVLARRSEAWGHPIYYKVV